MKKFLFSFLLVALAAKLFAVDFTYDGIEYTVISEAAKVCATKGGKVEQNGGNLELPFITPGLDVSGDIVIPETVYNGDKAYTVGVIGTASFAECAITSIKLPSTITEIGVHAFSGCSELASIEIQDGVTTIQEYALKNCSSLESVVLPNTITTLSEGVMEGCTNLKSVNIPNTLTFVPHWLFKNCKSLPHVEIPNTVTQLGSSGGGKGNCFEGCSSLASIEIPESVKSIESGMFKGCSSLESIVVPDAVTYMGGDVFSNCTSLKYAKISDSLRSFEYGTFAGCTSLESFNFPRALDHSYYGVFKDCTNLKEITIHNQCRSLGSIFINCTSLLDIKCYATTPPSCENDTFYGLYLTYITLHVVEGCKETYQSADYWKNFGNIIDDLKPEASSIILTPSSVFTHIGATVHMKVDLDPVNAVETVKWRSSDESIAKVSETGLVTPLKLGQTKITATIGNMSSTSTVYVRELEDGTSWTDDVYVYNLLSLSEREIRMSRMHDDDFISGIYEVPETLEYCGITFKIVEVSNLLVNCKGVTEVILPKTLRSIGKFAFQNCTGLKAINIPDSVNTIDYMAFMGCTNLEKVYYSDKVQTFGKRVFMDCQNLRSITIPEGVTSIPESMLEGCSSITEVLVPNSVQTIGAQAFKNCSLLKNVSLGNAIYAIGDYAFDGCPNITDIHSMALNPPTAEATTFASDVFYKAMITVQEQALSAYKAQNPWSRFSNYLTVNGPISLSHYNVDMAGNEVFQLGIYGSDSKIDWSSSNPAVAYANECGLIVAMGITGSTVISAKVDGEKVNCNVIVSSPRRDYITKLVSKASESTEDEQPCDIILESVGGNPPMVNVRLVPVGSRTVIDWTTSNSDLATVDNGIVTFVADGDVDFGVETENGLDESITLDTKDIDTSCIESISCDSGKVRSSDVYDITGRLILANPSDEQIKQLSKGLYIIRGSKVLVK